MNVVSVTLISGRIWKLEHKCNLEYIISSLFFVTNMVNLFPCALYADMVEYTLTLILSYLNL